MSQDPALQSVIDFLSEHPDEYDAEFIRKVSERGKLVSDPTRPGQLVFDVERHRRILGRRYRKGKPLDSYITYWERYAFDPARKCLEKIGIERPSEFHIENAYDLDLDDFSFEVTESGEGKFVVSESCTNEEVKVQDLAEALALAERLVGEMDLSSYHEVHGEVLGPGQSQELEALLRSTFKKVVYEKIRYAWAQMEVERE